MSLHREMMFVCLLKLTHLRLSIVDVITLSASAHRPSCCIQERKWRSTSRCLPFLAQCELGSLVLSCGLQHRSCRKRCQPGHDGWNRSSLESGFQVSQPRSCCPQLRRRREERLRMIPVCQSQLGGCLWNQQSLIYLPPRERFQGHQHRRICKL